MTVSERLPSCCGPSRSSRQSQVTSQRSKPQKLHRPHFEWTTKSLLWYLFDAPRGRPPQSQQPSFRATSPRPISMFLWIDCRSVRKQTLWTVCFIIVKKLECFYKPRFGRISLNISLSIFCINIKKLQAKVLNSTCRRFSVCKLSVRDGYQI